MNRMTQPSLTQMTCLLSPPQAVAVAAVVALQLTMQDQELQMGMRGLWARIKGPIWTYSRGVGQCCHGVEASRNGGVL